MRQLFLTIFLILIPLEGIHSSAAEYVSPNIKEEEEFHRRASSSYLKCYCVKEWPEHGFGQFSFKIIAKKETTFPQEEVGKIGISYVQKASRMKPDAHRVEIGSIEINEKFRRQGYGEGAIRTILGIFRSDLRSNLIFDYFWLTVSLGQERQAARCLYEKIGFEIEKRMDIGYQNMHLQRVVVKKGSV